MPSARRPQPSSYLDRLRAELAELHRRYGEVLDASMIHNVDPNRGRRGGGMVFIGFVRWDWAPSNAGLERDRMALLGPLRAWIVRFRLLFPNPVPSVEGRIEASLGLLERWLVRDGKDHGVPTTVDAARAQVDEAVAELGRLLDLLPSDPSAVRLVVDTNTLIGNPDLAAFVSQLGPAYTVHVQPVVLRELDDLKSPSATARRATVVP